MHEQRSPKPLHAYPAVHISHFVRVDSSLPPVVNEPWPHAAHSDNPAVEEYVAALEVAEERGRKRGASQEELDSLRLQLAELHERLALLPDFYVQQVFGAEAKPGSLIDALIPDRDGEAPLRAERAPRVGAPLSAP